MLGALTQLRFLNAAMTLTIPSLGNQSAPLILPALFNAVRIVVFSSGMLNFLFQYSGFYLQ